MSELYPACGIKVMVGTLHAGEREFPESRRSVEAQTYEYVDHVVISGHPNKEAHALLYKHFLESDADLLIKIDADMVLLEADFIDRVVTTFTDQTAIDTLAIAILDFFSGEEMVGINAYRRTVDWRSDRQIGLFTDSGFSGANRLVIGGAFLHSCVHSPNPSPFQAFHFGVHRGLKVFLSADYGREGQAATQAWYLERTWENFLVRGDDRLGLACLGFELALAGRHGPEDVDYTRPGLRERFEELGDLSTADLRQWIKDLRAGSASAAPVAAARGSFRGTEFHHRKELRLLRRETDRETARRVKAEKRGRKHLGRAQDDLRRAGKAVEAVRRSPSWRLFSWLSQARPLAYRAGDAPREDPLSAARRHLAAADGCVDAARGEIEGNSSESSLEGAGRSEPLMDPKDPLAGRLE